MKKLLNWAEQGKLPDTAIRFGIRQLLRQRIRDSHHEFGSDPVEGLAAFARQLTERSIAEEADKANEQHYELPPRLFEIMLGPRLKYSSGYWPSPEATLAESEDAMLKLCCDRAGIEDGMDILEMGCGWGSLTLWMAEQYPHARITAVSNSATQSPYIMGRAADKGLHNVQAFKADANSFIPDGQFDRIVSVEMFEHVRNYAELMRRVSSWLKPGGALFVHIFAHARVPYLFENRGPSDWMTRYFFSGGTMPSHDLLPFFNEHLEAVEDWRVNGLHYSRTLEAWLVRLDQHRDEVLELMGSTYGRNAAAMWLQRWRIFLLACSELFAYNGGDEWGVSHYRFEHRAAAVSV